MLLADEINRATPRIQSTLLEAMDAGQVTSEGEAPPLPEPFFVLALDLDPAASREAREMVFSLGASLLL